MGGTQVGLPSEDFILNLPRWARIVLGARAAERIDAALTNWPVPEPQWRAAAIMAVEFALKSARSGTAAEGGREITALLAGVMSSIHQAARAQDERPKLEELELTYLHWWIEALGELTACSDLQNREAAPVAHLTVSRLLKACYTVALDAGSVRRNADEFGELFLASTGADALVLERLTREERWDDKTPVDSRWLGALWPLGAPKNLPNTRVGHSQRMLLEIAVPAGTPPEQIEALVAQHALTADRLHAASGGSGLRIEMVEVYAPADIEVGGRP